MRGLRTVDLSVYLNHQMSILTEILLVRKPISTNAVEIVPPFCLLVLYYVQYKINSVKPIYSTKIEVKALSRT